MPLSEIPDGSLDASSLPVPTVVEDSTDEEETPLSQWMPSGPGLSGGTAAFLSSVAGFEIELPSAPAHTEEPAVSDDDGAVSREPGPGQTVTTPAPAPAPAQTPPPVVSRPAPTPAPAQAVPPAVSRPARVSPPAPAPAPAPARTPPPAVSRPAPAHAPPLPTETPPVAAPVERELRQQVDPVLSLADAQTFTISLPGSGWVFIEGPEGILFHSRSRGRDEEIFTFRTARQWEEGQFLGSELVFQQQDYIAGINRTHREEINVDTLAFAPTDATSESSSLDNTPGASGSGGFDSTGSILSREEFAEQWPDLDPEQREFALRVLETAENHPPVEQVVLLVSALELIEYSDAELIFRLARLLEQTGPVRDIYRSHQLYQQVRDNFPFSPHRETSRQRIEFLERHFLLIR